MTQSPMLQIKELCDHIYQIVARWEPEGMQEVLHGYQHWPDALDRLGQAWKLLHDKAGQYPIPPMATDLIAAVHSHQTLTTQAAIEIAPTIGRIKRQEIENWQDRRNRMWDLRVNPDGAAR